MLEKIVNFLKRFWIYFAIGLGVILGASIFLKKDNDYNDFIEKLQESYKKQLQEINDIRDQERAKYKENEQKYKETISLIEAEYEIMKQEFNDKKKKEVEKIVKKYDNKPNELAQKLSEITGFKIILPEE